MAYDEELADRLRAALAGQRDISEQKMFGGLAFLVCGHLAVSASSQGGLLLRVEPADHAVLASEPHAAPFIMRGREMTGWLRVDPAGLRTDDQLQRWVELGVVYARSLPSK